MKEKFLNNKIIIFGGSHHNTLGVVRSLGEKGIFSYAILVSSNAKDSIVLKSIYIIEGWIFNTYSEALQFIINKFSHEFEKPVIIATSDDAISALDLSFHKLVENFHFPSAGKQGHLTSIMDKEIMSEIAKSVDLNVAKTWLIKNKIIPDNIEYPCITKPISSIASSKEYIRICRTRIELLDFIQQIDEKHIIQIQKYIIKEFEYQLIGCSINGGDLIIIPGYTEIIRSTETTNTGFLKYLPIQNLVYNSEKCSAFIKACNYSGLFSLEFIKGKDGIDYFLEINFRNDGNAYAVTAAGVNLPFIWVMSCVGLKYSSEQDNAISPILVMPELVDVFQVYHKKITLKKWLEDVKNTDCFIYYNKRDKAPFYFELRKLLFYTIRHFSTLLFTNLKR